MTCHSKTLSVVRRVARQETPLLVRLSRRLDLHDPLLDASTGQAEARVLTTHPSSCTPPTTSGSSGRARPAMIASQVGFRLGLGLASPKRKGTRRRHCLRSSVAESSFQSKRCRQRRTIQGTLPSRREADIHIHIPSAPCTCSMLSTVPSLSTTAPPRLVNTPCPCVTNGCRTRSTEFAQPTECERRPKPVGGISRRAPVTRRSKRHQQRAQGLPTAACLPPACKPRSCLARPLETAGRQGRLVLDRCRAQDQSIQNTTRQRR